MLAAILATLSFALQNLCCKEFGRRYPSTFYAQTVMALFCTAVVTVIMAVLGGAQTLTPKGYLIAAGFGLCFVITLASMTLAMGCGHMGLTVLIQNSALVVPILYGILFWGESFTLMKGIGTACILLLLVLSVGGDETADETTCSHWNKKRWMILTALAFTGNCALSILQGMMSRECGDVTAVTFTFWTSLFSVAVALICIAVCALTGSRERLTRGKKDLAIFSALCTGIGAGTAGGNCLTIVALMTMPGVVLFPLRQGALVLVMWLLGILIYKEKITKRGILMLIAGLAGIVLLNL